MKVTVARAHFDVEAHEPAGRDIEGGPATPEHARVEDDARVAAAFVLREELDDRVPTGFLFAVAAEADVDGKRVISRELRGRLQQHVELALVVCDAAAVDPPVADGRFEGRRLP